MLRSNFYNQAQIETVRELWQIASHIDTVFIIQDAIAVLVLIFRESWNYFCRGRCIITVAMGSLSISCCVWYTPMNW